jgi:putative heme transporter
MLQMAVTGNAAPAATAVPPAWWRRGPVVAAIVVAILGIELFFGWSALVGALAELRAPRWNLVALALAAEIASMGMFARMQRALLRGAGTRVPIRKHVAMAYAAHSLSATLPGGPVFSTTFNFQQMRRFGASPAVASWCIALSGALSTGALIIIGSIGGILARNAGSWRPLLVYGIGALILAVTVRKIAQHPEWLDRPARGLLGGVNRVRRRPPDHGQDRFMSFVEQLRSVRVHPANFAIALVLAMANWLFDALCLWMCCVAVGATGLTATKLVVAYCAGMAAASVPIVPGGLGVIDGALILGLVAGGLTSSSAVAAVVLYRVISLGFIIGAGWLVWLTFQRRLRRAEDQLPGPA